jgi:hypothetical protein
MCNTRIYEGSGGSFYVPAGLPANPTFADCMAACDDDAACNAMVFDGTECRHITFLGGGATYEDDVSGYYHSARKHDPYWCRMECGNASKV